MSKFKHKALPVLMVLTILSFSAVAFIPAAVAAPSTFTVNVSSDESDATPGDSICETSNSGECTLRAALEEISSVTDSDTHTINFNIPGSGVHTITNVGNEYTINNHVEINGYSQPGSVANTAIYPQPLNGSPLIEITGTTQTYGLAVQGNNSVIRGLIINGFGSQIEVQANDVTVAGNYIGFDEDGITKAAEQNNWANGVYVEDGNTGFTIGGTQPQDRNIITGAIEGYAANLGGSYGTLYGNYFGVGKDGVTGTMANGVIGYGNSLFSGDPDSGTHMTVGGPNVGEGNLISGAETININGIGSEGVFQGNMVGTDYLGNVNPLTSGGIGITVIFGTSNVLIGGANTGEGNIIRGVEGGAVVVIGFSLNWIPTELNNTNISILGNTISDVGLLEYYGFGDSNMGIDLMHATYAQPPQGAPDSFDSQGPTPNDTGDADNGANDYINTPVLNSAQQVGSSLVINYDLDADGSSSDYRVEFYANDESNVFGHGPGQTYLGFVDSANGTNLTTTLNIGQ